MVQYLLRSDTVQKTGNSSLTFWQRLFRRRSSRFLEELSIENQILREQNEKNSNTIIELLYKIQNNTHQLDENIKSNFENQNAVIRSFRKINMSLDESISNIIASKEALIQANNSNLAAASALEIAEHMREFLIQILYVDASDEILKSDRLLYEENSSDQIFFNLNKIINVILNQTIYLNQMLEKHNYYLSNKLWTQFNPDEQECEILEKCSLEKFKQIINLSEKNNLISENQNIKELIIMEIKPALWTFSLEKELWILKRFAKVIVLKAEIEE